MPFRVKAYANKSAEGGVGGKPNRVSVMMDVSEARALVKGDKEMTDDLKKAIAEQLPASKK